MKIHAQIQKTALFVNEQGGQMEFMIRWKQSDNPQFSFVHLENPLYPYYKHLVNAIKTGKYKPPETKKTVEETDDEEDDDDDEYYLHPSLLSGKAEIIPEFTIPTINFKRSNDDSYSILVRNLKSHIIVEDSTKNSAGVNADSPFSTEDDGSSETESGKCSSQPFPPGEDRSKDKKQSADSRNGSCITNQKLKSETVLPPPDIQSIIDKMAEYVAKNGQDFESTAKRRNNEKYAFLNSEHEYHQYYLLQKMTAIAMQYPVEKRGKSSQSPISVKNEIREFKSSGSELHESNTAIKERVETKMKVGETAQCGSSPILSETASVCQGVEEEEEEMKKVTPIMVAPRIIKGPISFSLKSKDSDKNVLGRKNNRLLQLDDSDGEGESVCAERKRTMESVSDYSHSAYQTDRKPKKRRCGDMESKLAENRLSDKLAAAARERLAQQNREKQLKIERKLRLINFYEKIRKNPVESSSEAAVKNNHGEVNEARIREKQIRLSAMNISAWSKDEDRNVFPSISEITSHKKEAVHTRKYNSQPVTPTTTLTHERWSSPSIGSSDEKENPINSKEQMKPKIEWCSRREAKKRKKYLHSSNESNEHSHRSRRRSPKSRRSRSPRNHKHRWCRSRS